MAQYDVIIVGAGPAGMTAAIYAARADMNVLLLDKLAPGGQIINTNEIQNYPGVGTINGAELAYQMFEHTQQFDNIAFDYGTVKSITDEGKVKRVLCEEDDKEFTAKPLSLLPERDRDASISREKISSAATESAGALSVTEPSTATVTLW